MALPVTITGLNSGIENTSQPFISSGGNVYVFGRDATDDSFLRAFKATDPTSSFSNVGTDFDTDATAGYQIWGLSAVQISDVIHIVTGTHNVTSEDQSIIKYHTFNMATDAWVTTNEAVTTVNDDVPNGIAKHLAVSARSDGDIIIIYNGNSAASMGNQWSRVYYGRRESAVWTVDVAVDNGGAASWFAGGIVIGSSDRMHLFFTNGTADDAYQRTLTSANALETFPSAFDTTVGATDQLILQQGISYVSGANTKVRYPIIDATASTINSAKLDSADAPTVTQDTDITGADNPLANASFMSAFAADGTTLWHTLIGGTDSDIYTQSNADDGGWSAIASFYVGSVNDLKTNIYTRGSDVVLAITFSEGTSIKYHEKTLSTGGSAWSSTATASVTWTGAATASTSLSASALASVTWTGNGLYPAAFTHTAVASVTWTGVEIQAATEADWSSTAAASVTWDGTGLYPAALSSTAAASATFNGITTAASDWSSAAAASVTFNGAAEAISAWSAAAIATLTFDTREIHNTAWSSTAAASVTWTGAELQLISAAWDAAAAASLVMVGAATATSAWSAAAAATLTMVGASTSASDWNAAAAANLAATGASLADANWSSAAVATLTLDGAEVTPGAWSSQAAAALTWEGEASSVASAAWDAAAVADLAMAGASTATSDWSAAAAASVTFNGIATAAASWSSQAAASLTMTGVTLMPAAWNAQAVANLSMEGQTIGGAFTETELDSDAAASLIAAGAAVAAGAVDSQVTANLVFTGSDATAPTGLSAIDRDGWRKERRQLDKLEELEEEDIMLLMTAAYAYLETCRVNH